MPPPPVLRSQNGSSLPFSGLTDEQLWEDANRHEGACLSKLRSALLDAKAAGDVLAELKRRTKHGEWTKRLRENFDGSPETARVYMRIAANWRKIVAAGLDSATLEDVRYYIRTDSLDLQVRGGDGRDAPASKSPKQKTKVKRLQVVVDKEDVEFRDVYEFLNDRLKAENFTALVRETFLIARTTLEREGYGVRDKVA